MSSGWPGLINDIITRQCYLMECGGGGLAEIWLSQYWSFGHRNASEAANQPLALSQSDSRTPLTAHTENTPHCPPTVFSSFLMMSQRRYWHVESLMTVRTRTRTRTRTHIPWCPVLACRPASLQVLHCVKLSRTAELRRERWTGHQHWEREAER